MEDFLLLGQIPGTSIHITFGTWLVGALLVALSAAYMYDRTHNRRLFISAVYLTIRYQRRKQLRYFDQIAL